MFGLGWEEGGRTDLVGGGFAEGDAGCGAACEGDAGDVGGGGQGGAGGGAVAEDEVEDAGGEDGGLVDEGGEYWGLVSFVLYPFCFRRGGGIRKAVMLVISLGFATAVQPKARQGAIFHVRRYSGMFHGEMRAKTPAGDRCSYVKTDADILLASIMRAGVCS